MSLFTIKKISPSSLGGVRDINLRCQVVFVRWQDSKVDQHLVHWQTNAVMDTCPTPLPSTATTILYVTTLLNDIEIILNVWRGLGAVLSIV